jgi:hypothetical protein
MIMSLSDSKSSELIPTEAVSVRESELVARLERATDWDLVWMPRDGVLDDASIDADSIMVSFRKNRLMTAIRNDRYCVITKG